MYQRFSFDNLSPERQMELLEKQRKQQRQREVLQQQIEARKREKDIEKEKEAKKEYYQDQVSNYQYQSQKQPFDFQIQSSNNQLQPNQTTAMDFSKSMQTPNTFRIQEFDFTPQNYFLLPDRKPKKPFTGPTRERQLMSMSLTPNTIHDAFASLRRQIMATAASSVIGKKIDTNRPKERKIPETF